MKTASAVTPGRVTRVQYAVDVNTLEQKQLPALGLNEIGVVRLELDRPVAFDPYRQNRETGSFHPHRPVQQCHGGGRHGDRGSPLESQTAALTELDAGVSDAGGSPRRISLSELSVAALKWAWLI